MLAGGRPFAGRTAIEIFHKIVHEQPPPLSGGAAVGAFDRLLRHALAKNPADRPATAAAMAAELRDAMALAETAGARGAPPRPGPPDRSALPGLGAPPGTAVPGVSRPPCPP